MAEWKPDEPYSAGDTVTYRGVVYVRSQYPPVATTGTPPNVELGTDPKGDPIRSWEIAFTSQKTKFKFHPFYYRVIHPPMNSAQIQPVIDYGGESDYQTNAYGQIYDQYGDKRDYSVEFGQADTTPIPVIECPGTYCGVGFQQKQEIVGEEPPVPAGPEKGFSVILDAYHDLIPDPNPLFPGQYIQNPAATHPYNWYVFFRFNHALLFRRSCTITLQFEKVETTYDGSGQPINTQTSYVYLNEDATPTDTNYTTATNFQYVTFPAGVGSYYIAPANAFVEVEEPAPVNDPGYTVNYTLIQVYLNIADPNW